MNVWAIFSLDLVQRNCKVSDSTVWMIEKIGQAFYRVLKLHPDNVTCPSKPSCPFMKLMCS